MRDVAVVGAGPAGLAAAHVCMQWGLDTVLISEYLGGRTNFHMKLPFLESDDFIGGSNLALQLREQIKLFDWPHLSGRVDLISLTEAGIRLQGMGFSPIEARLGIIATGARPERINIPGEREFIMRGLAYSTGWYAPLFSGRAVAVIGSGQRAIQGVRHLSAFARQIYLITQSTTGPLWERAQATFQGNVTLMSGWRVAALEGADYVEQVRLDRDGVERFLDVDGVFVCAGITPNTSCVAHLVDLNSAGAIIVDGAQRTSEPRLLAAGDTTVLFSEQVLVALGAGARAGLSAWETRLNDGALISPGRRPRLPRRPTRPGGPTQNGH